MSIYEQYETVIGLEIHVQLSTQSKAFCSDDTRFGGEPNTQVSAISLGHPGTLPRLNKKQIEYAVRLGLALGGRINRENAFDRKNYFYADLPKGYQITQDRAPICIGGSLDLKVGKKSKKIRIHHIHMEEDAGKLLHEDDPRHSFIDLNRAGVPLLEIVSEPDLRSAEEVDAFMSAMRQLVRYLDISDGNMEQGSMRCDCNVSVRPKGADYLGERCEIKNLNSMRYARRAIAYEVKRQIDLIEAGGKVKQQTLNFDPTSGVTSPLREKEDAHDYRYFPEPDLPPVVLSDEFIEQIRAKSPALPWELFNRLNREFKLPAYDAELLTEDRPTAEYYLQFAQHTTRYKAAANLTINKIIPHCNKHQIELASFPISLPQLSAFIEMIEEGRVSNTNAYERIFPALIQSPQTPPLQLAEKLNLIQTSDLGFLEGVIDETLAKFPDKAAAYQKGKKGLLGFFMGQVMRASKGKADPKLTNKILLEKLK